MISMIQRHKRVLIALSLTLLFFMGGVVLMTFNIELTGTLFLIGSICTIVYLPLVWLLEKNFFSPTLQSLIRKEVWGVLIVVGLLCLTGAIESNSGHEEITGIFIMLLIFVLIFSYLNFRNHYVRKQRVRTIDERIILKRVYWSLGIGMGIVLLVLAIYDQEPLVNILAFFYFIGLFYLLIRWVIRQTKSIIKLKDEKAKTELLHLQSQINPHFFFNTLNNLYGLIEKDTKKAKNMVLNLSDMMRYSIYEGQLDWVTLEKEVEYLKNYIELHKARYRKKTEVQFNHHVQKEGRKVMPLLFIILLENAFKHGVENLRENAYVHINLIAGEDEIHFGIENNFDSNGHSKEQGIGLKNLKRRLELVYPQRHLLSYSALDNVYKAQLTLRSI